MAATQSATPTFCIFSALTEGADTLVISSHDWVSPQGLHLPCLVPFVEPGGIIPPDWLFCVSAQGQIQHGAPTGGNAPCFTAVTIDQSTYVQLAAERGEIKPTQMWMFEHHGPFTVIKWHDTNPLVADLVLTVKMDSAKTVPPVLALEAAPANAKKDYPYKQLWLFDPVIYPQPQPQPLGPVGVPWPHVIDSCDSHWHNPSCPGDPATWTSCTASGNTCSCWHT